MTLADPKFPASIHVDDVTIDLPVYDFSQRSLKKAIFAKAGHIGGVLRYKDKSTHATVRAISNLSFEVNAGDRVAIIGHNGAGKSTLLRALAGIYHPTQGQIRICGNVLPIFDISIGMDFESTGYENIYLRSLYLGDSLKYSDELVEDVLKFTELGEFAAMPIRTYSTGMLARLQFAITTAMRPDILIMDEGIGAGDASFFAKAQDRLTKMMSGAGIMILATHSEGLVKSICNKAILMEKGQLVAHGTPEYVWQTYIERASAA